MKKLIILAILVSVSYAQSETPPTPEILKRVLTLEGKWEAKASMQIGGKSYSFRYFMHYRKTADGNGLYMDESARYQVSASLSEGILLVMIPMTRCCTGFPWTTSAQRTITSGNL
jgi:hypothetical protein